MTTDPGRRRAVSPPEPEELLPAEVALARRRTEAERAAAARSLARGRIRRRIVPPLAVGSAVLFGSGVSIAFADHSVPQSSGASSSAALTARRDAELQAAAETSAMEHVRTTLRADQQMIEDLSKAAAAAARANSRSTTVTEQGSAAGAASGASGGGGYSGSGSGGFAALPPLPAMPSMNIPAIPNVSTGATHIP